MPPFMQLQSFLGRKTGQWLNKANLPKNLWNLLLLAFVVRLLFFFIAQPWDDDYTQNIILYKDAKAYHEIAVGLLDNQPIPDLHTTRTPIFPSFIAAIYFISGINPWAVMLIHIILSVVNVWILFLLARILFNSTVALIAALFMAIEPYQIYYCTTLQTETLFLFFFLISVYTMINCIYNRSWKMLVLSALAMGLATLTRPISMYIPFIFLIWLFLAAHLTRNTKIYFGAVYGILFLISTLPWAYRNYEHYGYFKISNLSGNLLLWMSSAMESETTGEPIPDIFTRKYNDFSERLDSSNRNSFAVSELLTEHSMEIIRKDIPGFLDVCFRGVVNIYTNLNTKRLIESMGLEGHDVPYFISDSITIQDKISGFLSVKSLPEIILAIFLIIVLLLQYIFTLTGIVALVRQKNYFPLFVLLSVILYLTILSSTFGIGRYRYPIMPFYLILGAVGIISLLRSKFNTAGSLGSVV